MYLKYKRTFVRCFLCEHNSSVYKAGNHTLVFHSGRLLCQGSQSANNWTRLVQNGTNLSLSKTSFQHIFVHRTKIKLKLVLKISRFIPFWSNLFQICQPCKDVRFGPKVDQIDPIWDKTETFSDQIN